MSDAEDFVVVRSHPDLLAYIDSLQRKNAEALSFYPTQVFEREAERGRLFLGLLNGEPCGYIYVGAPPRLRCHQVCIQYDARRRRYGEGLVLVMEDHAREVQAESITLRCGFDLDANDFWSACGYSCIGQADGGIRRMRTINVWRKELHPSLFGVLATEPASGKTDASVWRRHKDTGIVSQFVRGSRMQDYRAHILGKDEEA